MPPDWQIGTVTSWRVVDGFAVNSFTGETLYLHESQFRIPTLNADGEIVLAIGPVDSCRSLEIAFTVAPPVRSGQKYRQASPWVLKSAVLDLIKKLERERAVLLHRTASLSGEIARIRETSLAEGVKAFSLQVLTGNGLTVIAGATSGGLKKDRRGRGLKKPLVLEHVFPSLPASFWSNDPYWKRLERMRQYLEQSPADLAG